MDQISEARAEQLRKAIEVNQQLTMDDKYGLLQAVDENEKYHALLEEQAEGYEITNKMITDMAIKEMELEVQGDFGHKFANFLYRYGRIEQEQKVGE